jgi:5-methylcytosine-specific restriction enzyme subunit McrC
MTVAQPAQDVEIVRCREYGPIEVDASKILDTEGRLAVADGVLGRYVRADFKDYRLRLSAMGVTGLIPLTDRVMIQVRPRFPLQNMTHMVTTCGYTPTMLSALRDYSPADHWADWLLDVLADALLACVDTIRQQGLLRVYTQRRNVSSFPHGRVNVTATVTRIASRGINHRADYSWFERTIDNPPNRLLKASLLRLHAHYHHIPKQQGLRTRMSRLAEAIRLFHEVGNDQHLRSLNDAQVRGTKHLPTPRGYYRPALGLAVAILTGRGVSLDPSIPARPHAVGAPFTVDPGILTDVTLPTLLVKTDDLFEEFVRLSLQASFSGEPGIAILDGNKSEGRLPLYVPHTAADLAGLPAHEIVTASGQEPYAEPDVVCRRPDDSCPLVADVKYTNVEDLANRSEVEQVVLYGIRYKSPIVMTIHPKRDRARRGLHVAGRIGDILITQYRIDLSASDLDAEMNLFAEDLRALLASGGAGPVV